MLLFLEFRVIIIVWTEILEMLHRFAFSWKVANISISWARLLFPMFFGVRECPLIVWWNQIFALILILHHINRFQKLLFQISMYSFGEHSVEDFWWKLHSFFGCCQDLIEEGLKFLLAVFAGSENLLHDHVLSLCDLILNVIADSVFVTIKSDSKFFIKKKIKKKIIFIKFFFLS